MKKNNNKTNKIYQMLKSKPSKIIGTCAAALTLIGGGVGVAQQVKQPNASWTADGVWHDMNEANWQNVHPRLTVSAGATDAEVMQAYLNKWGSLPTVVSASGIPGTVSYEFGDRDGHGKATAIQWYATYPNGNKAAGPFTGLERQPQRPTINLPDGSAMILKTPVGHPLTEQQVLAGVSAHSNNGNDTEEQLQLFVTGLDQVDWNTPGVYDVKIEAKDRYNVPTIVTRTIQVERNSQTGDSNNNNPNNTGNSSNNNNQDQGSNSSNTNPGNGQQNSGNTGSGNTGSDQQNSGNNNNSGNSNQNSGNNHQTPGSNNNNDTHNNAGNDNHQTNNGNGSNSSPNNNQQNPVAGISIDDVITVTNKSGAPVYALHGDQVSTTGRVLAPNSPWKTQQKVIINGTTYYQVSTNEWVKAEDGQLQSQNNAHNSDTADHNDQSTESINGVIAVSRTQGAPVYALNQQKMSTTGRILAPNSTWRTAQKKSVAGTTYYQVSTNEWLAATDVTWQTTDHHNFDGVVEVLKPWAHLYQNAGPDATVITGQDKPQGSRWKVGQTRTVNGLTWYLVGNNAWLRDLDAGVVNQAAKMTLQDVAQVKSQGAILYNGYGNAAQKIKTLNANSRWQVGIKVHADGLDWYEVGNNAWINSNDSFLEAGGVVVVKATPGTRLYQGYGPYATATSRILGTNTAWKVNAKVTINGLTWYEVGNNVWINSQGARLI